MLSRWVALVGDRETSGAFMGALAEMARPRVSLPRRGTCRSRSLAARRASASTVRPRPATIALVAIGDKTALTRPAAILGAALKAYLSVDLLGGPELQGMDVSGEPAAVFGPMLDRAEAGHDQVVLACRIGGQPEPWAKFCLQQADRILVLTRGGPVPLTLANHPELQGCDLVGCAAEPGELAGWAAALNAAESHVIRKTELSADIARIARRLAGTSVGIVLSGGGARAFAHIGVLEELTAAGVTIDRVAGVSVGAMIGALFAMGHDPDEIDAICFEELVRRRPLRDITLPRHPLVRGERFRSMLHRIYGATLIEELPRGFFCGSAELRSKRLEITRQGPLWEAVGLSVCLPVIASAEVRARDIFADGSLVNNLPVQAMAEMGEGPVIAVDAEATFEHPEGTTAAGARDDRAPLRPGLGEMLSRRLLLGSENTSEAARHHADLVIKPRTEGVGLLEFHQFDAAREAGRVAARESLDRAPISIGARWPVH
jgi:NTE family protein